MEKTYEGLIIKGIGGFYYVEAADEIFECKARGIFRKDKITPLAGDRVKITVNIDKENTIDEIFSRRNYLTRPPVANIDSLIIVVSTVEPCPSNLIIDKLIAIAEYKDIEPVVVITKADLSSPDKLVENYKKAGIKTFCVSSFTNDGVSDLLNELNGKINVFTGNSGVGKSTLLNCIDKSLKLSTGEISAKLGRGRHTTRQVELYKLCGGYIADTPGFSSLDFERSEIIAKDELQFCFREFAPHLGKCQFTSCAHLTEKGCKVLKAIENGEISKSRHDSYVTMYKESKGHNEWDK